MRRRILFVFTDRSYLSKVLRHRSDFRDLGFFGWSLLTEISSGVSILLLMFVLRQDILDFKAWGDRMESNHLTILVLVYCWCFDTHHEGYQPEEGLMSLIHYAHEDEIPP